MYTASESWRPTVFAEWIFGTGVVYLKSAIIHPLTHANTHINADVHSQKYAHTHTHINVDVHSHKHTHTHMQAHTCKHTHNNKHRAFIWN
jgi:ABC-type nickel/cobalt efflux system permease component RcnA